MAAPTAPGRSRDALDGRREWLLAACGALLFGLAFSYPVLARLGEEGLRGDWDFFWHLHWVAYETVRRFGQLPLWNPYRCGGNPLFANPQASIFTPFFLLELVAGPVVGVQLSIALHFALAWLGGYALGRTVGLGRLASIATASVFPASSWFPLRLAGGHLWILPAAYLPFICAGLWSSIERGTLRPALVAGLFAALTVFEGGPYIAMQAGLLSAVIAVAASVREGRLRPMVPLALLACFSFGFAAIKLVPMWEFTHGHPRPMDFREWNGARTMATAFLSRNQDYHREFAARYTFIEYGAYIGVAGAVLAALGSCSRERAKVAWIAALAVFLALAAGGGGIWFSPAALLHRIPPFSTERAPSRFYIPAVLSLAVLSGFGVDLLRRSWGRAGPRLAALLVAAQVVDAWLVGTPNLDYAFEGRQPAIAAASEFQQHRNERLYESMSLLRANRGTLLGNDCVMGGEQSAVVADNDAAYRGEVHLVGDGTVRPAGWTPNELTYAVDLIGSAVLVVNQNYDRSWRLARGAGHMLSAGGLIGVKLPPGRQTIAIRYSDRSDVGAVITLLTCLGAVLLISRR